MIGFKLWWRIRNGGAGQNIPDYKNLDGLTKCLGCVDDIDILGEKGEVALMLLIMLMLSSDAVNTGVLAFNFSIMLPLKESTNLVVGMMRIVDSSENSPSRGTFC